MLKILAVILTALGSQLFKESEKGNNSHICGLRWLWWLQIGRSRVEMEGKKRNEKTSHLWVKWEMMVAWSWLGPVEMEKKSDLGHVWDNWELGSGLALVGDGEEKSRITPKFQVIMKSPRWREKLLKVILGTWFQSCWGWHFQEEKLGKSVKWLLLLLDLGFVLGHCYWRCSLLHAFIFYFKTIVAIHARGITWWVCWRSVDFPQFCLVPTEIWSDRPALQPLDTPCHSSQTDRCYSSVLQLSFI